MQLFPTSLKIFILNRLAEISGLLSIFLSIFIIVSIFTYSPIDPNLSHFTNASTANLGGQLGANLADILIQFFGLCSYALSIPLLAWSYKLIRFKSLPFFSINILSLPIFIIFLGTLLIITPLNSLSGIVASQLLEITNQFLDFSNTNLSLSIQLTLFTLLTLFFFVTSAGLSRYEWQYLIQKTFNGIVLCSYLISKSVIYLYSRINITNKNKTKETDSGFKKVEPKIDFDTLRDQPVQSFNEERIEPNVMAQEEIDLNDIKKYKPPSHCVDDLHNSKLSSKCLRLLNIVNPVDVKPDIASK